MSHSIINPAILYWGTPVVLITTINDDGSPNIGPMSSAWWLGDRCLLGLAAYSQTTANLLRTKQCVLNLASDDMIAHVNVLARTTGTEAVPPRKVALGYRHVKDKFGAANLTPEPADLVAPPRIRECPVQMEAELVQAHEIAADPCAGRRGFALAIEVKILRTFVRDELRLAGHANRIDPDAWSPMIMSFQQLYGLKNGKIGASKLGEIDEEIYRVAK